MSKSNNSTRKDMYKTHEKPARPKILSVVDLDYIDQRSGFFYIQFKGMKRVRLLELTAVEWCTKQMAEERPSNESNSPTTVKLGPLTFTTKLAEYMCKRFMEFINLVGYTDV